MFGLGKFVGDLIKERNPYGLRIVECDRADHGWKFLAEKDKGIVEIEMDDVAGRRILILEL